MTFKYGDKIKINDIILTFEKYDKKNEKYRFRAKNNSVVYFLKKCFDQKTNWVKI